MIVRSGETNPKALRKMGGSVLGHKWNPVSDKLTFLPKVFMGKKGRNGACNSPQLVPENLVLNDTFQWTKGVVLSTVASIFDPSGMIPHI